jgi:hypothetical protein
VILLDRVVSAADSLVPEHHRAWLRDSLRSLIAQEGAGPRRRIVNAVRPVMAASILARDGRIGPAGRRLIVLSKGGYTLSSRALLLEPLYFALPVSRQRIDAVVLDITEARLTRAQHAGHRLALRTSLRVTTSILGR